jgi:Cd2+/Zn2+-exporting ATPase
LTPVRRSPHTHDHGSHGDIVDGPWWRTGKARLIFVSGAALALAYGLGLAVPEVGHWAFVAAMAVGLVPIARRGRGAMTGTPFTIETLMTIAAVGAVFIGATEEAALVVFLFSSANCWKASPPAGRAPASRACRIWCRRRPWS